jgi:nitrogen-specific signal transduction histidine kinase
LRVIEDISRVRTLEEELLSAKKMDAIGRLSGGIAHDFNNILQTIFGFVELTERALEPPHLVEPYLREIREAAERAESLTRQLLLFSHRRVARKSTFPLEQVLLNIDSILRRELGPEIDVDLELTPDIKGIYVDDGQLEQVILNLASNSRHAMPYGGLFRMKTREIEVDSELLTRDGYPVPLGAYIELTVSDDGRGMDADTLAKAFDPFFTTRRSGGGTGIGLATVNELVRQNNGFVWLHSQINEGATLRLIFPACDHDSPKPKPKVAQRTVAEGHVGKVVLLVEHEPAILDLVKSLLTEQGYVVIRASSGDAALRAVLTHTGTIDLLLTDVIMPGLHGPEIHQRLRQDRPRLPAVFMSGYSSEYAAQEWNVDPASVFLQKPFSPDRLLEAVDTALD